MIKKCTKCGVDKEIDAFRERGDHNGLQSWCIQCCRDYDKIRGASEKRRRSKNKVCGKWRNVFYKDDIKTKARKALRDAVRRGKITRLPCEVCGDINSEGHHDDYSKPFDVNWLCRKHHIELHRKTKMVVAGTSS